jgi:hypothetical protein
LNNDAGFVEVAISMYIQIIQCLVHRCLIAWPLAIKRLMPVYVVFLGKKSV